MQRRRLLGCCAGLAAGLFTGLDARADGFALGEGLFHPCLGALPDELARHEAVARALVGIDPAKLWDTHAHLLGIGDSGSGCRVHAAMNQWWRPVEFLRKRAILNAACVDGDAPSVDRAYVERLLALSEAFPGGARWLLLAFDAAHDDAGHEHADWTGVVVPNDYAAAVAREHPQRFEWVASIHPYRADAIPRLEAAIAGGARALKWLPNAMNIDLRDRRCGAFFDRLVRSGLPLIMHCGDERAVPGAHRDELGNPLLVRVPLARGVRVIVAHCASLGRADDTDRPSAPSVPAFDLFARLMDERDWQGRLLGDISALFQTNRSEQAWRTVLRRGDWHDRLLHGSDHPLPGLMPLYSPAWLARAGLLDTALVEPLRRIRAHNPLLFDFVQKRSLRDGSARLADAVFDTRRHFAADVAATVPSIPTRST